MLLFGLGRLVYGALLSPSCCIPVPLTNLDRARSGRPHHQRYRRPLRGPLPSQEYVQSLP